MSDLLPNPTKIPRNSDDRPFNFFNRYSGLWHPWSLLFALSIREFGADPPPEEWFTDWTFEAPSPPVVTNPSIWRASPDAPLSDGFLEFEPDVSPVSSFNTGGKQMWSRFKLGDHSDGRPVWVKFVTVPPGPGDPRSFEWNYLNFRPFAQRTAPGPWTVQFVLLDDDGEPDEFLGIADLFYYCTVDEIDGRSTPDSSCGDD